MTFIVYLQRPHGPHANPHNHVRVVAITYTTDDREAAHTYASQLNHGWPVIRSDRLPVGSHLIIRG